MHIRLLLIFLLVFAAFHPMISAQTEILDTDFRAADIKTYGNGEAIIVGSDSPPRFLTVNIGSYDGSMGHWCADPDADNFLVRVTEANGARGLEMTGGAVSMVLPPRINFKKTPTLDGAFVFTVLPSSARTDFLAMVSNSPWASTGPSELIHFTISPNMGFKFTGGAVPGQLKAGTKYRVDFSIDLTDPQQHTWRFTLSDSNSAGNPLFSSGKLNTRNPTALPAAVVFHQFARTTGAEPQIHIHRIKFEIPGLPQPQSSPSKAASSAIPTSPSR